MPKNSVKQHYENLLERHYSWMFGDFDQQIKKNLNWFTKHNIQPLSGQKAIDFGCGSGFQSLALSSLGYEVTSVDFNQSLLDELKSRDSAGTINIIHSDLLEPDNYSNKAPFELAVCMGDTLPHLPSLTSVSDFFGILYDLLETGGNLVLSFRDLSVELSGTDRFIPVQNDQDKIMTVFLEYEPGYVNVHDLIYERKGDSWELEKSTYRKIRLSAGKVKNLLEKSGFNVHHSQTNQGMVHIIAAK